MMHDCITMADFAKKFRDPIHGFIPVYAEELEIIQDPIFQRLRRIKQLSFTYLVYHGAEHSRFGHVLGTMHLVDKALRCIQSNLNKQNKKNTITDEDIRIARFAALLHDIGHRPFSHALDRVFPESHETHSKALVLARFKGTIENTRGLGEPIDSQQVADLITGNPDPEKPFLTSLISGQLDVDKFDYLLRDSHYTGVKYGMFDLDKLLNSLFVNDGNLVVLNDGYFAVEQIILARYYMFSQVYLHKTKRSFEGMAEKLAIYLNSKKELNYPTADSFANSENLDEFVQYDDAWFLNEIKKIQEPALDAALSGIQKRIPFKEISNSENFGSNHDSSLGFHRAMEIGLSQELEQAGIDANEIIFDQSSTVPYKLRPYEATSEEEEPDTIMIYRDASDIRPIETKSSVVKAVAQKFSIRRIFAAPEKKDLALKYTRQYGGPTL